VEEQEEIEIRLIEEEEELTEEEVAMSTIKDKQIQEQLTIPILN